LKKTKIVSFCFDSPLVIIFSILVSVVMILNSIAEIRGARGLLYFFSAPASFRADFDMFNFKEVLHYLRLFFHIFGNKQWIDLARDLSFVLLLGPQIEKTYGAKLLFLMIFVCAFASGVLNVCFSTVSLCGSSGVAFMMILLAVFMSIKKQSVPVSAVLLLFLYVGQAVSKNGGGNGEIIHLIGGICGSLFGMISPENKASKKSTKSDSNNKLS